MREDEEGVGVSVTQEASSVEEPLGGAEGGIMVVVATLNIEKF